MDSFEKYISTFDYASIGAMKIDGKSLLEQIKEGSVDVIDVRFKEEYELWHLGFIRNIPLNELPGRLHELKKDKTIVTVCPHETRSNIATHYLLTHGFKSRFLTGGLLGLESLLLGGGAKKFFQSITVTAQDVNEN